MSKRNYSNLSARIDATKAIGAGERITAELTDYIVRICVPTDFDPKARGAVSALVLSVVDPNGTQKQKIGPKGSQVTTNFGRGFDTLVRSVKRELIEKTDTEPDWIALVRQAAKNAHDKGRADEDVIMAAVREALAAGDED